MKRATVLLCFALSVMDTQSASVDGFSVSRIVNGYTAGQGQFPHQALLAEYSAKGASFICGGSIISEKWVITAAHCCFGIDKFLIDLGAHYLVNTSEPHRIQVTSSEIHIHHAFNMFTLSNDVAVIRTLQEIPFNAWIQPVKLPPANIILDGVLAIASGWGKVSSTGNAPAAELQFGNFRCISNEECKKSFGNTIDNGTVCARGVRKESICFGDSGGPLVLNGTNILIGINSFGSSRCLATIPNGFVRVSNYLSWIKQKTGVGS